MILAKEFFNLILDFGDDWMVIDIEVDSKDNIVYLDLKYIGKAYYDPDSMEPAPLYDHSEMREWRHLDVLQYKTYVRCRIPRIKGKDGKVKQIRLDWSAKHDRHTYHFEVKAIDLLRATKNQTATAELLDCSFSLINRIIHRCTERGMSRRDTQTYPFEHLCLDEKSYKSGHKYVSVVSHPKSGAVIDVAEGRDQQAAISLLMNTFTEKQRKAVNSVSLDMWKPYINAVNTVFPNAELVHDKFHLVAYLNKSIDQVRRREAKQHDELKNSRYALLKNTCNLTERQREKFEQIKASNLQVSQAWHIKENFKSLFGHNNNEQESRILLRNWATDALMKNIKEVTKVAFMMIKHIDGVVNALISNLNNAMAERLNGKIQELKLIGRGYRRFENFRSAILFFHGELNLYP